METLDDTLQFFAGRWRFKRIATNLTTGQQSCALGLATFSVMDARTLMYHEKGKARYNVDLPSQPFYRDYRYDLTGNGLNIYQASGMDAGAFYQTYNLQSNYLIVEQVYICMSDRYEGLYYIKNEIQFTLATKINGPHKDQIIQTQFERL